MDKKEYIIDSEQVQKLLNVLLEFQGKHVFNVVTMLLALNQNAGTNEAEKKHE